MKEENKKSKARKLTDAACRDLTRTAFYVSIVGIADPTAK